MFFIVAILTLMMERVPKVSLMAFTAGPGQIKIAMLTLIMTRGDCQDDEYDDGTQIW